MTDDATKNLMLALICLGLALLIADAVVTWHEARQARRTIVPPPYDILRDAERIACAAWKKYEKAREE